MLRGDFTIVPLSSGRIHKHTTTYARRIIHTMTSDHTPQPTRRALRRALQRLFDCTDIGKRRSLTRVDNVAAVLACTGLYYLDERYRAARRARVALCRVMEAHDWATNPRLIRLKAYLESRKQPRARRAQHPFIVPSNPVVQQIAA
ncbi:MAG: hypothetical protein ICV60_05730 [Pyrinomonadaceae bacterium]|nr:hypothetical protein [Pyrinomonadaceae bacterium]